MKDDQLMELRSSFTELLIANENHFGNLEGSELASKAKVKSNTSFEEIGCLSYNPQSEELRASVAIKRSFGYGGDLCSKGSVEYVRFYLDYGTGWIDQGLAMFNAHDIPHQGSICYTAVQRIKPKQTVCKKEVLPRAMAILSWSQAPPANQPNWTPVWGNKVTRRIQIAPEKPLKAFLAKLPHELAQEVESVFTNDPYLHAPPNYIQNMSEWEKEYGRKVERERLQIGYLPEFKKVFPSVPTAKLNKSFGAVELEESLSMAGGIVKGNCNTSYEELHCIGFNRQYSVLHGAIEIKRPYGYFGNLCQKGSREFVTFFIRPMGSPTWQTAGTTSVQVHDLKGAAKESIWYNAWLPIDIEKYRRTCKDPQLFEVQAILSWNAPATLPDVCPYYGNIVNCKFEIPPREGEVGKPFIESLGGIQVSAISPVTGLATGQSLYSTNIKANNSPFDGIIEVNGSIYPGEKYQVLIKEPGSSNFLPMMHSFKVALSTFNPITYQWVQTLRTQTPDSAGYYDYLNNPPFQLVGERRLMNYIPAQAGMHELKIRTLSGAESDVVTFRVDKDTPEAKLTINPPFGGSQNCKHQKGVDMTGTFEFKDSHFRSATIYLTPGNGGGNGPKFDLTGDNDIVYPLEFTGTEINATTGQNTWKLVTNNMKPCGYVINLVVRDRTIVNSAGIGKAASSSEGFCLE